MVVRSGIRGNSRACDAMAIARTTNGRRATRREGSLARTSVRARSLFGVGAPEALVIGIVSLLVFGPKGLADIAKQIGATLREFQPTIKELQEVSREFQDTLRDEIGLDDTASVLRGGVTAQKRKAPVGERAAGMNGAPSGAGAADASAASADASAAVANASDVDSVTEEMKAASARMAWGVSDDANVDASLVETPSASANPGEIGSKSRSD